MTAELIEITIGRRMREYRKRAGRKQGDIARAAHIGQSTLSLYETGQRAVPLLTALIVARELGVSITDFLPAPEDVAS